MNHLNLNHMLKKIGLIHNSPIPNDSSGHNNNRQTGVPHTSYWTPDRATLLQVGIHDYDHLLDDMSLEAYQHRFDQSQTFMEQATALEGDLTDHTDLVNLKILKRELETYMTGFPFKG